ncbi:unnamed protein product [Pseudo-nitzschia multistriata]|uniref:Uncharacterized protein n=1 Tax=Pseudo-nitzschia multistriata TaxID=183589 RepID=A0A448ZRW4_9STRA|nr:unnamed protein product [Pseudo-nitzschia multistriata]
MLRGASERWEPELQCSQRLEIAGTLDAHALLHEPIFHRESMAGVRRQRKNERFQLSGKSCRCGRGVC